MNNLPLDNNIANASADAWPDLPAPSIKSKNRIKPVYTKLNFRLPDDMILHIISWSNPDTLSKLCACSSHLQSMIYHSPMAFPRISQIFHKFNPVEFPNIGFIFQREDSGHIAIGMNKNEAAASCSIIMKKGNASERAIIPSRLLSGFDSFFVDPLTNYFLAASRYRAIIWDPIKNEIVKNCLLHSDTAVIDCQENYLVQCTANTVFIRTINNWENPETFCNAEGIKWARLSKDLKYLYTYTPEPGQARDENAKLEIWNFQTKKIIKTIMAVSAVPPVYDPNHNLLFVFNSGVDRAGHDVEMVKVLYADSGELHSFYEFFDDVPPEPQANVDGFFEPAPVLPPREKGIRNGLYFHSESSKLFVLYSTEIFILDIKSTRYLPSLRFSNFHHSADFDDQNNILLLRSQTKLEFWDIKKQKMLGRFECSNPIQSVIQNVIWNKEEKILYVLESDGKLSVFDYSKPKWRLKKLVEQESSDSKLIAENPILEILDDKYFDPNLVPPSERRELINLQNLKKELKGSKEAQVSLAQLLTLSEKLLKSNHLESIRVELILLKNIAIQKLLTIPHLKKSEFAPSDISEITICIDAILFKAFGKEPTTTLQPAVAAPEQPKLAFEFNHPWAKENHNTMLHLKNFLKTISESFMASEYFIRYELTKNTSLSIAEAILWQWIAHSQDRKNLPEIFQGCWYEISCLLMIVKTKKPEFFTKISRPDKTGNWVKLFDEICESGAKVMNQVEASSASAAQGLMHIDSFLVTSLADAITKCFKAKTAEHERNEKARMQNESDKKTKKQSGKEFTFEDAIKPKTISADLRLFEIVRNAVERGDFSLAREQANLIYSPALKQEALQLRQEALRNKHKSSHEKIYEEFLNAIKDNDYNTALSKSELLPKNSNLHTMAVAAIMSQFQDHQPSTAASKGSAASSSASAATATASKVSAVSSPKVSNSAANTSATRQAASKEFIDSMYQRLKETLAHNKGLSDQFDLVNSMLVHDTIDSQTIEMIINQMSAGEARDCLILNVLEEYEHKNMLSEARQLANKFTTKGLIPDWISFGSKISEPIIEPPPTPSISLNFEFNQPWAKENHNTMFHLKNFLKEILPTPMAAVFAEQLLKDNRTFSIVEKILWQWIAHSKDLTKLPEVFQSSLDQMEPLLNIIEQEQPKIFKSAINLFMESEKSGIWLSLFNQICETTVNNLNSSQAASASAAQALAKKDSEVMIALAVAITKCLRTKIQADAAKFEAEQKNKTPVKKIDKNLNPKRASSMVQPSFIGKLYQQMLIALAVGDFVAARALAAMMPEGNPVTKLAFQAIAKAESESKSRAMPVAKSKPVAASASAAAVNSVSENHFEKMYLRAKEALSKDAQLKEKSDLVKSLLTEENLDPITIGFILDEIQNADVRDSLILSVVKKFKERGKENDARPLAEKLFNKALLKNLFSS